MGRNEFAKPTKRIKTGRQAKPPLPPHPCPGPCDCAPTIAYLRVSTGRDEMISPDLQLATIVTDAARNRRRIIDIAYDVGTARSFTRRQVVEIVEAIKATKYNHVSLWKWSRWGRNLEESLVWLTKVRDAGGKVDSATEDFDQTTAIGRFGRDLILRLDQLYSEQIGEGWIAAHEHRRSRGLPHTGWARFGYDYVKLPDGERGYVINDVEAEVLEATYQRYVNGTSLRSLAIDWNAQGIATMGASKAWSPQSLGRMLDNGFAAGYIRERGADGNPKSNALSAFSVWRKGAHKAIIDERLWQAYKSKRLGLATAAPAQRRVTHGLSGRLMCGVCRRRLYTSYQGRNRSHTWVCNAYGFTHLNGEGTLSVSNAKALEAIRDWIVDHAKAPADIEDRKAAGVAARKARGEATKLKRQIDLAKGAVTRLTDMYESGDISREDFRRRRAARETEVAEAEAALSAVAAADATMSGAAARQAFTTLAERWDDYSPEMINAALDALFDHIVVQPRPKPSGTRVRSRSASEHDRVIPVPRWA